MEHNIDRRKTIPAIVVFYVIALLLRYLTNKTALLSGVSNNFVVIILQGAGPALGAFVALKVFRIKMKMSLKGNFGKLLVPLSVYWLFPAFLIGLVAWFTKGTFPVIAIFTILIYGLLEEIGWRGFLQQLLAPLPRFISLLIITVLWFVWHLNFEPNQSSLIFFLILLFGSWGIGLVADKTNSLLAVAAFHSLNNFFTDLNLQKAVILMVLVIIWILSIIYRHRLEKIGFKSEEITSN